MPISIGLSIRGRINMENIISLCDAYKDYFKIGAAVCLDDLKGVHAEILKKHFNSLTAENLMKFAEIHPEEGKFEFQKADKIKEFAIQNNLKMRGHTFVWHNQTTEWVFKDKNGNKASRELLLERLREHIKTVYNHYKDVVYAWDVVNEAVEDKSDMLYRKTNWLDIIGEDYIKLAFEIAREEVKSGELYYNDYNNEVPEKREKSYKLLKKLLEEGAPIDGVGLQAHWNIWDKGLIENLKRSIELYASLGLKIQITEMDISMFRFEDQRKDLKEPTSEMLDLQEKVYDDVFKVFREYRDVVNSVTLWGISDAYTWKDGFPVRGRKDWPLLFDVNGEPKASLRKILEF